MSDLQSANHSPESKEKLNPGGHVIHTFGDIEFVKVPAGKFLMGSSDKDEQAHDNQKPQHAVDISYDYYMARFPVTNQQYAAYAQAKGIEHPVSGWEGKHDHPVVNISWNKAMAYCQWLHDLQRGKLLRRGKLPPGLVVRLPTEAEWEKAARGTNGWIYPWGDTFHKDKCNSDESSKGDTTPVGFYSPQGDSPYGCADMAGNVWEWTHSLFGDYPYEPNDGRENENASGGRVVRGGSFADFHQVVRAAFRLGLSVSPYSFGPGGGFRVVVAPPIRST